MDNGRLRWAIFVHKLILTLQSVRLSSDVSEDAKVILDTDIDKNKIVTKNILLEMSTCVGFYSNVWKGSLWKATLMSLALYALMC